ncbi:MAG: hypothetical protein LBV60_22690 [Streptomyces sp.]|jgi:hypothetical protein|nr:hypothetical protein [Streptomyces sp.]
MSNEKEVLRKIIRQGLPKSEADALALEKELDEGEEKSEPRTTGAKR